MPTEPRRKISDLVTITTIPPGSFMIIETPTGTKKVSTDNLSFATVVPDPEPVQMPENVTSNEPVVATTD